MQEECNKCWADFKRDSASLVDLEKSVNEKVKLLLQERTRKKSTTLNFFVKACGSSSKVSDNTEDQSKNPNKNKTLEAIDRVETAQIDVISKEREKPSQEKSKTKIEMLQEKIVVATNVTRSNLSTSENDKLLHKLNNDLKKEKTILKRKISNAERQKKQREKKKNLFQELCEENPDVIKKIKLTNSFGRPRLEIEQPELLKTIVEIAMFGCGADDRRRSDVMRSCKTLDDLHAELKKNGFTLSRSATYLRLIPRSSNILEGKRHVQTVPVKLSKAQSDLHAKHPDAAFCTATIRSLETIASVLGPDEVFFLSQDDKSRVPIGITAAKDQAPILMHVEYRVSLPDHDWVVAERHKLIPSVYAAIVIKPEEEGRPEAVSYSGPTYIAIRSGKHSSSNAETHAVDFNRLMRLPEFEPIIKTDDGSLKPIVIFTVDGGPDENPRYQKVISAAIKHFTDFHLDAIFIATNAPGRSAYNRVERRMAPLSRELSGN